MKKQVRSPRFVRSASTIAVAASLISTSNALAQEAPDAAQQEDEGNVIVVTGIRASLDRAMDIKRNASGVVDAISAEAIGKFPDTNLAESLQRIPGVTIDRRNGEGSKVTVRGFGPQFNLVTLNGRQLATSDVNAVGGDQNVDFSRATSRSFDFSNLASEGVQRLEVYKTGRAAIPSGGIGAAINIVTLRPLDGPEDGLRGSFAAKAVYDTSRSIEDITPEASGVLSWSDPEDMFGASLVASYSKRESEAASATSNAWNVQPFSEAPGLAESTVINNPPADPNQLVAIPNDSRYHYSYSERERLNGQLTLQFRPMENLTLTGDALYARNQISEERMDQTNWFNRPFDTVTFDDNPVVATAVFIEEGSLYGTKDLGLEQQYRATLSELQSYGLNAEWWLTDTLSLTLDANHSKSKSVPDAPNGASSTLFSMGAPVVDGHSVDYSGDIPQQQWQLDDTALGNGNGVLDIGDLGTQMLRTNVSSQRHRINHFQADLAWDLGDGGRFEVGAAYIDSRMTSERMQTQQTLGNWGITNVGDIEQYAGDLIEQFCLECQFDHFNATDAEISFRGNAVELGQALSPVYADMGNPVAITGDDFDQVDEEVWAGYGQFTWDGQLMGHDAGLVAGVRWERTKVDSTSLIVVPQNIIWTSDDDFTRVVSATVQPVQSSGEYNNLLPAIDFRISPMDDVVARISYSKTIARPDYGNLFASQSAQSPDIATALGGVATGATGDPGLSPLISDNFDVSLEWYFGPSSYVSAGFFYKKVKNFVGTARIEKPLFGLRDPSSGNPGTRSGIALEELQEQGIVVSNVSLFTMTALLIQNNGDIDAASAEYQANIDPATGQINQTFVDQVLDETDIVANADDPLFNFSVQTPVNNETGNIHGIELQGQHFFGDSGFGIAGSFTMVRGDIGADVGADPDVNVFALIGLSDSFNITGIYEKGPLSARVAYTWRDDFLSGLNRGGDRNPVFTEAFGTLDANLSYDFTEQFGVTLEAINILGEPIRTHGRDETNLWFAQELHPRVLFGLRYTM